MNNTIEAKLKILFDGVAAISGMRGVRSEVTGIGDAARPAAEAFRQLRTQIVGALGVVAGAVSVRNVAALADQYVGLAARLRLVTTSQAEYERSLEAINQLARDYQAPLRETGTLYVRLASALRPLNGSLEDARITTEGLLAALRKTGATTEESASAALQFSQALASGVLQGDEFKSLAESVPPLLDALAEGLKRPRSELKTLGEQGKLTTAQIVPALRQAIGQLRGDASELSGTIGGSLSAVSNEFGRLVGESAKGSEGVRLLTTALNALAGNLGTVLKVLTAIALVLVSLKIGAIAASLVATGVAATAAAGGLGLLSVALRGVLAAVGGPLGLVVAIGSLAAAWLGLRAAQDKVTTRTRDSVSAERQKVAAELASLDAEIQRQQRENRLGVAPQLRGDADLLRSRLRGLDSELAGLERQKLDDQIRAGGPRGRTEAAALRDPATVAEFEKSNATRESIAKRFADERAAYERAKDIEIRLARESGDRETEQRLTKEKASTVQQQLRAEADALRAFDRDTVVTRVAQYRELFDQRLALAQDAIARELKANQEAFDEGLRDAESYLAERARLEKLQSDDEVAQLERQLAERRRLLAANQSLPTGGLDANGLAARRDELLQQTQEIARLEADITKKKRDQADADAERLRLARHLGDELRRQRVEIDSRLAEATGSDRSPEQVRAQVVEQYRSTLADFARLGADQSPVFKLIDVEVNRQLLAQVEREFDRTLGDLRLKEGAVDREVAAGNQTKAEGERDVLQLRREQVPVLQAILERAEALAATEEDRQRIRAYRQQLQDLERFKVDLSEVADSAAKQGLTGLLNDITKGAKSGKAALLDMVRSFAQAMLNVINQDIAETLLKSIKKAFSASGGSGSGGGGGGLTEAFVAWFAGLYHSGGIVGAGGGPGRNVSPALFAFAPRYHSGGIAGLRPNERPAILLQGEEVLPESDPRHSRNFKGGGLTYNATYSFNGVGGGDSSLLEQRAFAQQLDAAIQATITRYVAQQRRTGGIFSELGRR